MKLLVVPGTKVQILRPSGVIVNMSPDYTWSTHDAGVAEEGKKTEKTLSWVLT